MITFDAKLRALRGLRGITQAELAEKAEIGQWDVTTYERGLAPTPAKKEALERVFGLKFDAPEVEAAFQILAGSANGQSQAALLINSPQVNN